MSSSSPKNDEMMSCNLTVYETRPSLEKEMQCDIRLLHDLHTFLLPHIFSSSSMLQLV